MDLVALSIFLLAVVVCSVFVFIISVYGTKEVTFEENLKASHESSSKKAKSEAKKKNKKKAEISEPKPLETELPKRVETPDVEEEVEPEDQVDGPEELVEAEIQEEEVKEVPIQEEMKQSSSEATPTKKPKNKKNKIKIEEVVEQQPEPVVIEEPVKKAAPVNVKKANKKAKNDNQEIKPKITSYEDIKNLVVKTPLDDFEIQNIVDSLLSKQTGTASGVQESWVEASKENETKALHRQLADAEALVIEESGKVKSLTEKMALLRHELNQSRTTQVQSQQRYVNELESAKRTFEAKLHQLHQEHESQRNLVVNLQGQVRFHMSRANGLQATIDNMSGIDPAIYNELETLRNIKLNLEAECNGLGNQLNSQNDEMNSLKMTLNQRNHEIEEMKSSLKGALDKSKKLSDSLASMEKKNSSSSGQFEELKRVNQELDAQVKELTSMCMKQKSELSRLAEENERISDQLATYVERPRTEGQEANGNANANSQNGHNGNDHFKNNENKHQEEEQVWHKKYLAMSQEHEQILKEKDVIMQNFSSVESQYKTQVSKLEADLEDQRAKNDELRSKNWKTVEALNSVEQSYQKVLKNKPSSSSDNEDVKASVLRDAEQSQKLFLQRLFPVEMKDISTKSSHKDWLEELALKVEHSKVVASRKQVAKELQEQQKEEIKGSSEDDLQKLEGQVKHYKSVLDETETMLNQLQAAVESEESRWKSKLSDKENTLEKLQRENEALEAKIAAMEPNLNSVEEMETKLHELQEKLAIEEADKVHLQEQLNKTLDSEDMQRLQIQFDGEKQKRADLEMQLAKMNQLLSTGQEALQQEQKTVDMLRQQVTTGGTSATSNASAKAANAMTTNGQDEAIVAE